MLVKLPSPGRTAKSNEPTWSWRQFWDHEAEELAKDDTKTPLHMDALIADVTHLLSLQIPELRKLWGAVALEWATTCAIRHVACRSFQVFRLLKPAHPMLGEILVRLSTTASEDEPDSQIFAQEILYTLKSVVSSIEEGPRFVQLPQLVWAAVAMLGSAHEAEVVEAISVFTGAVDVMSKASPAAQGAVETARPASLPASIDLVRDTIQRGMRSSKVYGPTWSFVQLLTASPLATSLLCPFKLALPLIYATTIVHGLQAMELGKVSTELETHANAVAAQCEKAGQIGISRLMASLARNRFRTKDDFIRQAISNVAEYFTASDRVDIFLLYLGQLLNPTQWIRARTLTMLKSLVKLPPNCPEHEVRLLANNILITPRPAPPSILDKVGGIGAKMSWRVTGLACYENRVWAACVQNACSPVPVSTCALTFPRTPCRKWPTNWKCRLKKPLSVPCSCRNTA